MVAIDVQDGIEVRGDYFGMPAGSGRTSYVQPRARWMNEWVDSLLQCLLGRLFGRAGRRAVD
jgi:hypothetical protein